MCTHDFYSFLYQLSFLFTCIEVVWCATVLTGVLPELNLVESVNISHHCPPVPPWTPLNPLNNLLQHQLFIYSSSSTLTPIFSLTPILTHITPVQKIPSQLKELKGLEYMPRNTRPRFDHQHCPESLITVTLNGSTTTGEIFPPPTKHELHPLPHILSPQTNLSLCLIWLSMS